MARALALIAIALLGYEAWTLAGWIADGPHQVTEFREGGGVSWYSARVIEVLLVASMAAIAAALVRDSRRRGRLSFDAMLVIGLTSASFWDPVYNWLTPAWLYSSNWVNVNDWFANAPLVLNPDAGRMPWAVAPTLMAYSFWLLGFAVVGNALMRRMRERRPETTDAGLGALAFAASGALTVAAFALFKALDLMAAPGYRVDFLGGSEYLVLSWSGGLVFGAVACLRFFTDRRGLALTERGLDHLPQRRRTLASLAATVAACQIVVIVGWGLLTVPLSLYSSEYPETPRHLINGLCDAPPTAGTAYGPCPGSPGFRLPLR